MKTTTIDLRASAQEKETFRLAAERAGLSLSAWMRERLRKAATTELERVGIAIPLYQTPKDAAV